MPPASISQPTSGLVRGPRVTFSVLEMVDMAAPVRERGRCRLNVGAADRPAHRGQPARICRASPHVRARGPWEHGWVARTIVIVDDHADFRTQATELLE